MRVRSPSFVGALVVALGVGRVVDAQNAVVPGELRADAPTLTNLGVQWLVSGDIDRDASVRVRYRRRGDLEFRNGPPLFRVLGSAIAMRSIPDQFAGSIFDVAADTTYEIELTLTDADGPVSETRMIESRTRAWPRRDPETVRAVSVSSATELIAAFGGARPGDVITLANGTYAVSFLSLGASGTATNPIVVRGASRDGVILDAGNCTDCNAVEVYGSFVHFETMTIRNGYRALRFQNMTSEGNVVRDLRVENVVNGITGRGTQRDYVVCDNVVAGRLAWPLLYSDDGGIHADDQGIGLSGYGHVVCHNRISGFGDPMINAMEGHRSTDFIGNEIVDIYADGTELDRGEGNVRLLRNRFVNVYTAISIQPSYGGPIYVMRNVAINVPDEQIKFKSTGGNGTSGGVLILHNTFVSPECALNLQGALVQSNFVIANNLFVAPDTTMRGFTVDWTPTVDADTWNGNGYYPDGMFWLGTTTGGMRRNYANFAALQAAGLERDGIIAARDVFASGLIAPLDYRPRATAMPVALRPGTSAVDRGLAFPGLNETFDGTPPDLGAVERGCSEPTYGPRLPADRGPPSVPSCSVTSGDAGLADAAIDASPGDAHVINDSGATSETGTIGDSDAASDSGGGAMFRGGCGCRIARGESPAWPHATLGLAITALGVRQRRRARACSSARVHPTRARPS